MSYGLTQLSQPEAEPIDRAVALRHLRVTSADEEPYILEQLLPAARERAEADTNRQIITARWQLTLPAFPCGSIALPKGRIQSVESVTFVDVAGETQELLADEDWRLLSNREPGEIEPVGDWPATAARRRDAVAVEFRAGYGDDATSVPALLKSGILLVLGHLYENRQDVVVGEGGAARIPQNASDLFLKFEVGDEFINYELGL